MKSQKGVAIKRFSIKPDRGSVILGLTCSCWAIYFAHRKRAMCSAWPFTGKQRRGVIALRPHQKAMVISYHLRIISSIRLARITSYHNIILLCLFGNRKWTSLNFPQSSKTLHVTQPWHKHLWTAKPHAFWWLFNSEIWPGNHQYLPSVHKSQDVKDWQWTVIVPLMYCPQNSQLQLPRTSASQNHHARVVLSTMQLCCDFHPRNGRPKRT